MKVQCNYYEHSWPNYPNKFYCCEVRSQQIVDDQELEFIGNHLNCKTSNDVTFIYFCNCNLNKLPKNLSKVFPNLNIIVISYSKLKTICKNDLSGFKKLKIFSCCNNDIEFVPGNLFEDLRCLEWITFYINKKLKIIEPNLLNKLENLKCVHLEKNLNHNIEFTVWNSPTSTLDEVKNDLAEKFFALDLPSVKDFIMKQKDPLKELKKYLTKVKTTKANEKILKLKNEITKDSIQNDLLGDLKKFLQNENVKDFKIIIGSKEFMVHKFLLAARSPTLAETFSENPDAESLKLIDITEEMFEKILKFLYTDELPGEAGMNYVQLFGAAGRLQIIELKNFAVEKILENISNLNALELLTMANRYKNDELIHAAFEEVKKKYPEIPFKDDWSKDPERIKKVIEALRKKEEAIKRAESEFKSLLI
ncbi:unnamed protein product [Chironomus riparius]|uniref:BTB domain-containing protein n=1 Tax=Chironomus riparius TaxID=315576 RepID=A0A9N9S8Y1_9DIPT|nr:unnamed protein product [Chironomus riparius]